MSSTTIEFFNNALPALEAGEYEITVSQDIDGVDTEGYFDNALSQTFRVDAPQFNLDPNLVHAAYPAAGTTGDYAEVLPQIVLNRPTLPWEREFSSNSSLPWMALVVFQEGEISVDHSTNSTTDTTTVAELLAADPDVVKPQIPTEDLSPETLAMSCQTITLRGDVFMQVFPLANEIEFLAHVRDVDTSNQEAAGAEGSGTFATLIANRFPDASPSDGGAAGSKNFVHLVSLEGLSDYLVSNPPLGYKSSIPSQLKDIQLVSLYNWSFVSSPEGGQSFDALATRIAENGTDPDGSFLLKLPYYPIVSPTAAQQSAMDHLDMGFVPLSYETGIAGSTFAWYRGPLTAQVAQPLPKPVAHYAASAAASIYNREYGVFDQSYAAAWEVGRALALADNTFGANLLRFRRVSAQVINALMDKLHADQLDSPQDLLAIINSNVIRDTFDALIDSGLSRELKTAFVAAPSRKGRTKRTTRTVGTDPVQDTMQFLSNPEVVAALSEAVEEYLDPVASWLAGLKLLYGVPFNHLVPVQAMLPVESARFFYVDQNWLSALMDGALSVGLESSRDSFFYQSMKDVIDDAVNAHMQSRRSNLAGTSTDAREGDSATIEAMTGVLIRSDLVSGWSGLEIVGRQGGTQLKTLRMERLSSNVMLVLFLDVADSVEISQPQQGLQFGVESNSSNDWVIYLRTLSGSNLGQATTTQFPASGGFDQFFRPVSGELGQRVLNVNDVGNSLVGALARTLGFEVSPAQLALELVKSPERFRFA